jgi:putative acyl-CoA dehydrogenase
MNPATTHEVFNQSEPLSGVNLFSANRPLRDALKLHAPQLDTAALQSVGAEAGSAELQAHARLANAHKPVLHTHDLQGRRIDEVEFHPSYHALMACALQHGLGGAPWAGPALSHVQRAAGFMLFTEAEPSVLCPVSMSYAVAPALRANAGLHAAWGPKLAASHHDGRFAPLARKTAVTMGMGMTEKQGGSDVRANTTRAERDGSDGWGERWRLTGHKWFFSAPMCDAFLVLAQTDAASSAGLSCFFLPRWLPDGALNAIRIQRLKDKLGNHANASSEVEFEGAAAWLVGERGRGVPQILAMGALTRLDCALGTAGLMRGALSLALHHTGQRQAFGKRLIEQPLMKNVLADLALESEAATALAMRLAVAVDRTEPGAASAAPGLAGAAPAGVAFDGAHEAVMRRLLTPVAKFWICKRGSHFAQEAMECLGGNGYVEAAGQGVMARIYREMPLNSIWEGAGNIMALDLLRALRGADVAAALQRECAPAARMHPAFDRTLQRVLQQVDGVTPEPQARLLARDVALLLCAALLHQQSPAAVFAAFCDTRLAQPSDVFGLLGAGHDLDALMTRALPREAA